jgi:DNA polymerase-3 subunit beta
MIFTISRELLLSNLAKVISIIPSKSTFNVLQNILFQTTKNKLSIQGTDLEVFIKRDFSCDVADEGKVMVPGKKVLEILRETREESLKFSLAGQVLKIEAGRTLFSIPYLDPQEFPEMPKLPTRTWFKIPAGKLNRMVSATIFSVARDVAKGAMTGIFVQIKNKELCLVSTDGHRLSFTRNRDGLKENQGGEIIVPPKVFDLVSDLGEDEGVEIRTAEEGKGEESLIGFAFANTIIVSRVIQGPFPDYEKVIPTSFSAELKIARESLESSLRRAVLFSNHFTRAVKLGFPSGETMNVYASTPEVGEAKEDVQCGYQGSEMAIGFNAAYLLEILKHITTAEVSVHFTSPATAALVKPCGEVDPGLEKIFLLMPLRIENW